MKHYKKKKTEPKTGPNTKVSLLTEYKNKSKGSVRIANTPYLVILESPSKCKKIETYLGFQYKCIASNGHIRGLTRIHRSKSGFEPVFDILPEKAAHVAYMREIINHFLPTPENVFIATDDDREGEAIGWHICQTFGLPIDRVRRMLFHEITEKVIQDAARNTTSIRMGIVLAQQARQMLDQMVGFEISPLLTKRLSSGEPLSAGRCQTPALRFVYDKGISKGNADNTTLEYRVTGSFFSQILSSGSLNAILTESLASELEVELFLDLSKTFAHEMTIGNPSMRSTAPPVPFHTSRLLQYTNNQWNMSPKKTMEYCQTLYQHGYITYMRTESSKYSEVFLEQIRNYLSPQEIRKDYLVLLDETGHNPHEAIRVTDIRIQELKVDLGDTFSEGDKKRIADVYEAIWRRSLQSCMPAYEYKHVDVFFSAPQEKKYHTSLELPMVEGFTSISESEFDLEDKKKKKITPTQTFQEKQIQQNGLYLFLQSVKNPITCVGIEARFQLQEKQSSKYYTESSLIQTLEEYGIGRPSTYALLVETIQEREYVKKQDIEGVLISGYHYRWIMSEKEFSRTLEEKRFRQEKNKLVLQSLGKNVMETLLPTFDGIFSYDYTKEMERKLDSISSLSSPDLSNSFEICKEMDMELKTQIQPWKKEMQEKYAIDDTHELFFSKKGMFIREKMSEETVEKTGIYRVRNMNIDLEKLKRKDYTLEDLLEIPREFLGLYQEKEIRLKHGRFGAYILWGEETVKCSIKGKELWDITLEDIITVLQSKKEKENPVSSNILRTVSDTIEIRKGKYGVYIYAYPNSLSGSEQEKKKKKKNTPFYNLKLFPGDWQHCEKQELLDWIQKTYGIYG